jgi:protein-S-isoprenylcysteine O-methyltransferase Ste14
MPSVGRRAFVQLIPFLAVLGLALFLPAGTIRWWQGWCYLAVFAAASLAVTLYLVASDPGLLERRLALAAHGEPRPIQKLIQLGATLGFFGMFLVGGLDRRFGWSAVPGAVVLAADALAALAFILIFFVFRANSFAASTIEIGAGQTVVSTGPYRLVRHPMYSAGVLLIVATPVALGSFWGLILAAALILLIVLRLLDEERLLGAELPGYRDYATRTRYRLIPGIF